LPTLARLAGPMVERYWLILASRQIAGSKPVPWE
jgi:hypothetical protein